MRARILSSLVLILALVAASGARAQSSGRLESTLRAGTEAALAQQNEGPTPTAPVFGGDLGWRVKNSWYSLVLPGWSQLRGGHDYRAAFFFATEAAIWTSFTVFKVQAHSREDEYQDYASRFADVGGGDRDDDYWRAVGSYRSSEDYNEDRRRDLRAGLDPDGPEYVGDDAWRWQSELRYDQYNLLRRDANSAYDNADLVLVLALVNRLVAFVDAMRSGPPEEVAETAERPAMLRAGGFEMNVGLGSSGEGLGPAFTLSRGF